MKLERTVRVGNRQGIHARPALRIAALAATYRSEIVLVRDGHAANGRSILGILALGVECGAAVRVQAHGDDALAAVEAITRLIAGKFGER